MVDKQLALEDRLHYLPAILHDLEKDCAETFWNYSKITMIDLYKNNEDNTIQIVIDVVMRNKKIIKKFASRYDRFYINFLNYKLFRKWVFANDFSPVQNIISIIKR